MRLFSVVVFAGASVLARSALAQSPVPAPTTVPPRAPAASAAPPGAPAPAPGVAPTPGTTPTPGVAPAPSVAPAPGAPPAPAVAPAPGAPPPPGAPPVAPPPGYPPQPAAPGYAPGYPPYYQPQAPPIAQPPADAHSHSGFFLRMALGGARMTDSTTIEGGQYAGSVDAAGGALSVELDIGGAISRGFILAGSFTGGFLNDPKFSDDTRLLRPQRRSQLSMLAIMGDIYPNPSQGFHVGGALGLASLQVRHEDNAPSSSQDESGFGFSAHVGYEWWVGNYWGLGALGRFFYAGTRGDYGGGTAKDKLTGFALCFSATYN